MNLNSLRWLTRVFATAAALFLGRAAMAADQCQTMTMPDQTRQVMCKDTNGQWRQQQAQGVEQQASSSGFPPHAEVIYRGSYSMLVTTTPRMTNFSLGAAMRSAMNTRSEQKGGAFEVRATVNGSMMTATVMASGINTVQMTGPIRNGVCSLTGSYNQFQYSWQGACSPTSFSGTGSGTNNANMTYKGEFSASAASFADVGERDRKQAAEQSERDRKRAAEQDEDERQWAATLAARHEAEAKAAAQLNSNFDPFRELPNSHEKFTEGFRNRLDIPDATLKSIGNVFRTMGLSDPNSYQVEYYKRLSNNYNEFWYFMRFCKLADSECINVSKKSAIIGMVNLKRGDYTITFPEPYAETSQHKLKICAKDPGFFRCNYYSDPAIDKLGFTRREFQDLGYSTGNSNNEQWIYAIPRIVPNSDEIKRKCFGLGTHIGGS